MPFISERVWQAVTGNDFKDQDKSVHLEAWPSAGVVDENIVNDMAEVRKIVEQGLSARDEISIKIRQPLQELRIKNEKLRIKENEELLGLIKDELNVKEISFDSKYDTEISWERELSEDLILEGRKREIVRNINSVRKKEKLTIKDEVNIKWHGSTELKKVFEVYGEMIKKETISNEFTETPKEDIKGKTFDINGEEIILEIEK